MMVDLAGSTAQSRDDEALREVVRARYAERALRVLTGNTTESSDCCGGSCCSGSAVSCGDPITGDLYRQDQVAEVPDNALEASLGCGNPTALIELRPGETVLDLGSGGGIDVILSARRVGPTGKAYGVDMTDEMLQLARANATIAGVENVEFLKGEIENIPLPDQSVDVVISNCVINLAADKARVLREAFRVLKPGGRFAVADVAIDGPVPGGLRSKVGLWVGCIAGALERDDYARELAEAGFVDVQITPTRYYRLEDLGDADLNAWLAEQPETEQERLATAFFSAFVRATRP